MSFKSGEPVTDTNSLPVDINNAGKISVENSTTTPLAGDASWTGEWESIEEYQSITVIGSTDVAATLYGEFSDTGKGGALRSVQLSLGDNGALGIHGLIRVAKYFRARVVNGPSAQGSINVQTIYSAGANIAIATSRAAQTNNDFSDVLNVRQLSEPLLDEARGKQGNRKPIHKFGRNPAVAASTSEVVELGGELWNGWLTSADTVRVKAGGDATDTAAGTGARTVVVEGLDPNFDLVQATLTTAGASASASSTQQFIRIVRAWVTDTGSAKQNAADIVIETTGGLQQVSIEATHGQSEACIYTVPAGKTAYIRRVTAVVEGGKPAHIHFFQRQGADRTSEPFLSRRVWHSFADLTGIGTEEPMSYFGPFPEKTDLYVMAAAAAGGSPAVSATMCIILVDGAS